LVLGPEKWESMRYDLALELSRFGVGYSFTESPFGVSFFDTIVVNSSFSETDLLELVQDIERADILVNLIVGKVTTEVTLSQPSTPHIEDFQT
jgi:hypothetical protein